MTITILHVEDDPTLSQLVRTAFASFGFQGEMLAAHGVAAALSLLAERAHGALPVDLILCDMRLRDGTGLDLVRLVRSDPYWILTPVVLLSSETATGVVREAYALGANCYVPKTAHAILQSLRALYQCWVESSLLPGSRGLDRAHLALARAINLRSRTSEVYLRMAELPGADAEEMSFWLDCSLNEGNLANLFAVFRHRITETEIPAEIISRVMLMQDEVERRVRGAEQWVRGSAPETRLRPYWGLALVDAIDQELFAECLGYLFPRSPVAAKALKEYAAIHLNALATFILTRGGESEFLERAERLRERAGRLFAAPCDSALASSG